MKPEGKVKSITKTGFWMWVIFILVFIFLAMYSLFLAGPDYLDGVVGNLLATILGIILGVPAAVSIERWRVRVEQSQVAIDAENRRKEVLELLSEELTCNKRLISNRLALNDREYPHPDLKIITWQTFSSSGEIKWVDNPLLLSRLAAAYHYLQIFKDGEEKWYQAELGRNPQQIGLKSADIIRSHMVKGYPQLSSVVDQTIQYIRMFLNSPDSNK